MRRVVTFATAAAVMAGAMLASSAAASAAEITISNARVVGDTPKRLEFDPAQADVDATYTVRSSTGSRKLPVRGISLARVLELAGADNVYSGIDIARPEGGAVRVSKYAVLGQGLVPVIFQQGPNLVFLRPSNGSSDFNEADLIEGAGIALTQIDLGALDVKIKASKTKIKAGQAVKFEATASGGGAGDSYRFSWDFNDGSTGKGATVQHRFKRRGTYRVLVNAGVTGSDRTDPAIVMIQVGTPTKSKKQRPGGGTNNARNAPLSGVADGENGDGEVAGSADSPSGEKRRDRKRIDVLDPALPVVTGELLSANATTPLDQQSSLAARSGQVTAKPVADGIEFSDAAMAAICAVVLLLAGLLKELGAPASLRRVLRGRA